MWEVVSYGERPYWEMTNQDVSTELVPLKFEMKYSSLSHEIFTHTHTRTHTHTHTHSKCVYMCVYICVFLKMTDTLKSEMLFA